MENGDLFHLWATCEKIISALILIKICFLEFWGGKKEKKKKKGKKKKSHISEIQV